MLNDLQNCLPSRSELPSLKGSLTVSAGRPNMHGGGTGGKISAGALIASAEFVNRGL